MARTAQIHFQRVTFSLPKKVVKMLRDNSEKNQMSSYVAGLIEEDMKKRKKDDVDSFFEEFDEFRKDLNNSFRSDKSSLEILREIRHGKK